MALSQSSTVVKAVKSGMERSSRGWEGLRDREEQVTPQLQQCVERAALGDSRHRGGLHPQQDDSDCGALR